MNKSLLSLAFVFFVSFALIGCTDNKSPQKLYCLGREYKANDVTWKVDIDKEHERFFYDIKATEGERISLFVTFSFRVASKNEIVDAKKEFTFKDVNDKDILLEESSYYTSNATIYFYYNKASDGVKNAIESNDYSVAVLGKTYLPEEVYNSGVNSTSN